MATIDVINQAGAVVGSIELNDAVFGIEPHQQAMYDALVMQMASRRQGTADTKGRSEVSGGGRKPYRQKVQDVLVKVLSVLLNLEVVEQYSELLHVTMHTALIRKFAV